MGAVPSPIGCPQPSHVVVCWAASTSPRTHLWIPCGRVAGADIPSLSCHPDDLHVSGARRTAPTPTGSPGPRGHPERRTSPSGTPQRPAPVANDQLTRARDHRRFTPGLSFTSCPCGGWQHVRQRHPKRQTESRHTGRAANSCGWAGWRVKSKSGNGSAPYVGVWPVGSPTNAKNRRPRSVRGDW